jgi:hypothetical protein
MGWDGKGANGFPVDKEERRKLDECTVRRHLRYPRLGVSLATRTLRSRSTRSTPNCSSNNIPTQSIASFSHNLPCELIFLAALDCVVLRQE